MKKVKTIFGDMDLYELEGINENEVYILPDLHIDMFEGGKLKEEYYDYFAMIELQGEENE